MNEQENIKLKKLLNKIYSISQKYDLIEKLSEDKFNIFDIMRKTSSELTHSRFIAELLNPKGSHGRKDVFLKLFLDEIGIRVFNTNNADVEIEKFIGPIDEKQENGGRIDICISEHNSDRQVFIENKLYADDQHKQLLRYHNHNHNAHLIYLTLEGKEASAYSTDDRVTDIINISYKMSIINWMESCHHQASDNPKLRETISQYLVLLKNLTNQSRSSVMSKEILNLIIEDEIYIKSAFEISKTLNDIKRHIVMNILVPKLRKIAEKYDMTFSTIPENKDCLQKYWGFDFKKPDWNHVNIRFEFQTDSFRRLIYGIYYIDSEMSEDIKIELGKQLREDGDRNSHWWLLYKDMKGFEYWYDELFLSIYNGDDVLLSAIEKLISELSDKMSKIEV